MPWIICIILLGIIIYLSIRLNKKLQLDKKEVQEYNQLLDTVTRLKHQKDDLKEDIQAQIHLIDEYQEKVSAAQANYYKEINKKSSDWDAYFNKQRATRQSEMDTEFENLRRERVQALEADYQKLVQNYQNKQDHFIATVQDTIAAAKANQDAIVAETETQQQRFEGLLAPLQQYEKDRQERLFYTIQVPDEYKDDIDFLLTTVAAKVQHPDVINKLVWSEYVKPYLDDTFKRVGIEDKSGIYKITNLDSGKAYIGKSTNVKKRLSDHMKASVGLKGIAWQAVHDAILKEGFWNWSFEIITYCDKDQLNELEKYYINFFKSNEFGFNRTGGGEG